MPVAYEIDASRALIRTRCFGDCTFADVVGHFESLERDPALPREPDVLLDMSELGTLPKITELHEVVGLIQRLKPKTPLRHCAIVATRNAMFGLVRMFAVFAESQFRSVRVFRDRAEADAWLAGAASASERAPLRPRRA